MGPLQAQDPSQGQGQDLSAIIQGLGQTQGQGPGQSNMGNTMVQPGMAQVPFWQQLLKGMGAGLQGMGAANQNQTAQAQGFGKQPNAQQIDWQKFTRGMAKLFGLTPQSQVSNNAGSQWLGGGNTGAGGSQSAGNFSGGDDSGSGN